MNKQHSHWKGAMDSSLLTLVKEYVLDFLNTCEEINKILRNPLIVVEAEVRCDVMIKWAKECINSNNNSNKCQIKWELHKSKHHLKSMLNTTICLHF